MSNERFSKVIGVFGIAIDRFYTSGYKKDCSLIELFKKAKTVKDIKGLELVTN